MTNDHNQAVIRLLEQDQAKDDTLKLLFDPDKGTDQLEQLQQLLTEIFTKDELAGLLTQIVECVHETNSAWLGVLKDSITTAYKASYSDKQSAAASEKANRLWNANKHLIRALYDKYKAMHPNNRTLVAEKIANQLSHLQYDSIYKWLSQIENGKKFWE